MYYKKFGDTIILRLERGEEIINSLLELAKKEDISLASIQGLGACDDVTIGHYSVEKQEYRKMDFHEELEMIMLNGNLSQMHNEKYLHVHASFGRADGTLLGGHLNKGVISATAEIFIRCLPGNVDRFKETETGLNLWKL